MKKTFALPLISLLSSFLLGASHLSVSTNLETYAILASPDNKQFVILMGKNRYPMPVNQAEKLAAAIAACQQQDHSSFEIYIQKPSLIYVPHESLPPPTMTDFEHLIQRFSIAGITIQDCEVRNIALLTISLLNGENPGSIDPKTIFQSGGKTVCSWGMHS